jgi:hypothetical protein
MRYRTYIQINRTALRKSSKLRKRERTTPFIIHHHLPDPLSPLLPSAEGVLLQQTITVGHQFVIVADNNQPGSSTLGSDHWAFTSTRESR